MSSSTFTERCTIHCGFQPDTGYGFVHCKACHDRPEGRPRCDILAPFEVKMLRWSAVWDLFRSRKRG